MFLSLIYLYIALLLFELTLSYILNINYNISINKTWKTELKRWTLTLQL